MEVLWAHTKLAYKDMPQGELSKEVQEANMKVDLELKFMMVTDLQWTNQITRRTKLMKASVPVEQIRWKIAAAKCDFPVKDTEEVARILREQMVQDSSFLPFYVEPPTQQMLRLQKKLEEKDAFKKIKKFGEDGEGDARENFEHECDRMRTQYHSQKREGDQTAVINNKNDLAGRLLIKLSRAIKEQKVREILKGQRKKRKEVDSSDDDEYDRLAAEEAEHAAKRSRLVKEGREKKKAKPKRSQKTKDAAKGKQEEKLEKEADEKALMKLYEEILNRFGERHGYSIVVTMKGARELEDTSFTVGVRHGTAVATVPADLEKIIKDIMGGTAENIWGDNPAPEDRGRELLRNQIKASAKLAGEAAGAAVEDLRAEVVEKVAEEKVAEEVAGDAEIEEGAEQEDEAMEMEEAAEDADEQTADEADDEEAASEEALSRETTAEETAGEEVADQETPDEETAVGEAANQETPDEEAANQETPSKEAAGEDTANQETTAEEIAGEGAANQETSDDETAVKEAANQKTPDEEAAGEDVTNQETLDEEAANQETPGEEVAGEDAANQEVPGENARREEDPMDTSAAPQSRRERLMEKRKVSYMLTKMILTRTWKPTMTKIPNMINLTITLTIPPAGRPAPG